MKNREFRTEPNNRIPARAQNYFYYFSSLNHGTHNAIRHCLRNALPTNNVLFYSIIFSRLFFSLFTLSLRVDYRYPFKTVLRLNRRNDLFYTILPANLTVFFTYTRTGVLYDESPCIVHFFLFLYWFFSHGVFFI